MNCAESFTPDARNARHQRYCSQPPCQAASKRASQAKWLAKPENRNYHGGTAAVARVQAWRQAKQGAEFGQEELVVGPLTTGSGGPAGDEGPDQGGVEAVIRGRVVRRQGAAVKIATHTEAGNRRKPQRPWSRLRHG
ncbi:MAG: hypothetical protein KAX51_02535 [Chromatiaceae bacterium]|nr:hypothetical protein [Chromatiaceae bacterium]MBP6807550.1 hypothetical protein [Chromatiaceae bacterium]MBP8283790.1 hypothetical protein [Chromatiaceae bacterium]MBP8288682.1 hypothetical protein [Chromatiaceae bacterium]MBP9602658.1 hypothetical protein [Chromatiaceae bacterium]